MSSRVVGSEKRRRLGAVLRIGMIWAVVWLPIGGLVALYAAASLARPNDLLYRPIELPLFLSAWTIWGGLSGAVFAAILGAAERRRTLEELSMARTALWGALGAMSAPALLTALDLVSGAAASPLYQWRAPLVSALASFTLGGLCAAVTLTVARRPSR